MILLNKIITTFFSLLGNASLKVLSRHKIFPECERHLLQLVFPLSKKEIKEQSHLVTVRSRWHICAALSGSFVARQCVWLSATCPCTERCVPGSETATYGHRHTSLRHVAAPNFQEGTVKVNWREAHLATTSSLWRSSADTLSGSSFLMSTKSSSTDWAR